MKYLTLNKASKDIRDDVSGYTVKVSDAETKKAKSLFLLNVVLSSTSEDALKKTRSDVMSLQEQIIALGDTKLTIDINLPTVFKTPTIKLTKAYKDILYDGKLYSVGMNKIDTGNDSSFMLMGVSLTPTSEISVANIRKQIETLQSQIETLETTPMAIDVVLPAVLQKEDFTKVEVTNGV